LSIADHSILSRGEEEEEEKNDVLPVERDFQHYLLDVSGVHTTKVLRSLLSWNRDLLNTGLVRQPIVTN
jgi:hypothetical protein